MGSMSARPSAVEIRSLASGARFERVGVHSESVDLRLPPPADFLWQYIHSTPMAAVMGQVDRESREALERDYCERCRDFVQDGALVSSVRMTTLTARR